MLGKSNGVPHPCICNRAFGHRGFRDLPAVLAQFWGDRPSGGWGNNRSGGWGNNRSVGWGWDDWGDRRRQRPGRDFFPFFGERYERPAPAVDNSKPPPPRKLETPPTSTVVVVGDSMADWLGHG